MKKFTILMIISTLISISGIIFIIYIDQPDSIQDIKMILEEKNNQKEKIQSTIHKMPAIIKQVEKGKGEKVFITRKNIYHIKNGRIIWYGKLISKPLFENDKYYIASGKHIFCTYRNGDLKWKKNIPNEGIIEIRGDLLIIKNSHNQKIIKLTSGDDVRK